MTQDNCVSATVPVRPIAETHMTEGELARMLGRTPMTLQRWRRIGEGPPFIRLGKTPLYARSAVAAYLSGGH